MSKSASVGEYYAILYFYSKSKGMEIVPWVKPEAIIKGSTSVPVVISSCPE